MDGRVAGRRSAVRPASDYHRTVQRSPSNLVSLNRPLISLIQLLLPLHAAVGQARWSDDFSKWTRSSAKIHHNDIYSCFFFLVGSSTFYGPALRSCSGWLNVVVRTTSWILTQRHLPHYSRASKARVKGRCVHAVRSSEWTDVGGWRGGLEGDTAGARFAFVWLAVFVLYMKSAQNRPSVRPRPVNWFFKLAARASWAVARA